MCDAHRYQWADASRGMARHGKRAVCYTLRCTECGQIKTVETTPAGGTPWRHTFTQNMQWAARVEREMQKRRA